MITRPSCGQSTDSDSPESCTTRGDPDALLEEGLPHNLKKKLEVTSLQPPEVSEIQLVLKGNYAVYITPRRWRLILLIGILSAMIVILISLLAAFLPIRAEREHHRRQSSSSVKISVPLTAPSAAVPLSQSLLSLSIEQDRWTDWAGTSSPNQFFLNTLENLRDRTGANPWIRIGADSEDNTLFDKSVQTVEDIFPAITTTVPYPEATNVTIGDGFYQVASHLPANTHVIWGLNLKSGNLTNTFLSAQSLAKAFSSSAFTSKGITLDLVEIGNEPDFFEDTVADYVKQWTTFATNVSSVLSISPTSNRKFFAGAFATASHSATSGFSPQGALKAGLLSSQAGKSSGIWSQHHYSGSFCAGSEGLLQDLMTKSTIRSNLTNLKPDIAAVKSAGLGYFLGETNSYSCHGAPGVSNTAGAALWTLDYTLFAASLGIQQVFFHEGIGYKYDLIQPIALTRSTLDGSQLPSPLPPHVQPQYYAAIIVAEAISTSSQTSLVELSISDSRLSGYAFFEGSGTKATLKRAVLVESQAFLADESASQRGKKNVTFSFTGGSAPQKAQVKRLKINHADDTSGLLWAGQSFETSDAKPNGTASIETVNLASGVIISDTEAVLLTFE